MRFRYLAAFLAVVLLAAMPAVAQEVTGSIIGAVKGPDGALLPGATVTAVGPIGTVTAVTDERGEYRFPRLPSGRYKVTAALSGFGNAESNVDLNVGASPRADFTLALGTVTVPGSRKSRGWVRGYTGSMPRGSATAWKWEHADPLMKSSNRASLASSLVA